MSLTEDNMATAVTDGRTDVNAIAELVNRMETLVLTAETVCERRHVDSLQDAISDLCDCLGIPDLR